MGYYGDDRHGGDSNRWRDRDDRWGGSDRDRDFRSEGRGWNEGRREERGWGSGFGGDSGDRGSHGRGGGDDRGFFERAGDEVRSWFGDDEAQRRRERDERRWQQEQGMSGRRDNDYGRHGSADGGSYGWMSSGWGNQAGESWNRDRPGVRNEREGWFTDSIGGERGERLGGSGGVYGASGDGSSGRHAAYRGHQGGGLHDPHYSEWRRRQLEDLDRDYDEYRREHQSKFEQEFGGWRQKRQGQRQMLNKVTEQMEVIGSDGQPIGTVDKVRGDRIILTKSDENAGGIHHSIPCSWVDTVDERVTVNKTAEEAMSEWRNEERSRALFEREDSGSPGPHMLNRSFSGTYSDRDRDDDR